jgi:carbon storage regulator
MLVLSRRPGEKIVIGNEVVVEVISVSGEGVKLGITAPSSTSIHRFEVFTEIQKANEVADVKEGAVDAAALGNLAALIREKDQDETT